MPLLRCDGLDAREVLDEAIRLARVKGSTLFERRAQAELDEL